MDAPLPSPPTDRNRYSPIQPVSEVGSPSTGSALSTSTHEEEGRKEESHTEKNSPKTNTVVSSSKEGSLPVQRPLYFQREKVLEVILNSSIKNNLL